MDELEFVVSVPQEVTESIFEKAKSSQRVGRLYRQLYTLYLFYSSYTTYSYLAAPPTPVGTARRLDQSAIDGKYQND